MITSSELERIVRGWSEADDQRSFNFTSGHLGAILINEITLSKLIETPSLSSKFSLYLLFAKELITTFFFTILPFKTLLLFIRTFTRKFFSSYDHKNNNLTILSLGHQSKDKDAYFGQLINVIEQPLIYIKIVGGYVYKSKDYIFLESFLTKKDLLNLFCFTFLNHACSFLYLMGTSRCISNINEKIIYILIGMKELNLGVVFNNLIITQSLDSYVNTVDKVRLIYPIEGRNWEKVLVKKLKSRLFTAVGYLHMAITPRHLSLHKRGFYKATEVPSIIVANSIMSFKLLENNFPSADVRKGYFLRGVEKYPNASNPEAKTLMFALTGNVSESKKILETLFLEDMQDKYSLIIRLNKNTASYPLIRNLATSMGFRLYNPDQPILPHICFYRSSSVALNYLNCGVLPVYLALDEIISQNSFELDNNFQFPTIKLDNNFGNNIDEILKVAMTSDDFIEASNYYLDHNFHTTDLKSLVKRIVS